MGKWTEVDNETGQTREVELPAELADLVERALDEEYVRVNFTRRSRPQHKSLLKDNGEEWPGANSG